MASLKKPCQGKFAEVVQLLYRDHPSQAMQQQFACATCGQPAGLAVKKGEVVPETHWPSGPRRVKLNGVLVRFSRVVALFASPARRKDQEGIPTRKTSASPYDHTIGTYPFDMSTQRKSAR